MDIPGELLFVLNNQGTPIAQNVVRECLRYLNNNAVWPFVIGATCYALLGQHWQNVLRTRGGVGTVSFTIHLTAAHRSTQDIQIVLREILRWFSQGDNSALVAQVADATQPGISATTSAQHEVANLDVKLEGSAKVSGCSIPIQNMLTKNEPEFDK
ncbi:MAG: hypothetical protein L6R41_000923 [Letrouitia leprolyta]|nr:MAG: hypothetical protein L6R41_000923 [Letrouitia leprolyta]